MTGAHLITDHSLPEITIYIQIKDIH